MARSRGASRHLTDAQILKVLAWNREAVAFKRSHGTVLELAVQLGTSVGAVRYCIAVNGRYTKRRALRGTPPLAHSTLKSPTRTGRPRHLSDAQVAVVMRWHRAYLAFHRQHGTAAMRAAKLGVSAKTFYDCIQRQGRYKQVHWQDHAGRRQRRSRGKISTAEAVQSMRNALLHAWRRTSVVPRRPRQKTRR